MRLGGGAEGRRPPPSAARGRLRTSRSRPRHAARCLAQDQALIGSPCHWGRDRERAAANPLRGAVSRVGRWGVPARASGACAQARRDGDGQGRRRAGGRARARACEGERGSKRASTGRSGAQRRAEPRAAAAAAPAPAGESRAVSVAPRRLALERVSPQGAVPRRAPVPSAAPQAKPPSAPRPLGQRLATVSPPPPHPRGRPHPPAMAFCRRLARLAAHLQDPRKVAAFQRLCGVEGPSGWAEAEQRAGGRGPVVNGGPPAAERAGGRGHPAGNGTVPGGAAPPQRWRRRPRRNSLTEEDGSQEFSTRSRFLYYLFSLGTELGNELFYILFFPFCIWNLDAWLGRRLIIIWVWVMYLGQCTKDVIRWPRPASPPVVKLEVFYNSEYSMPSTHAMSGTAIPLALLLLSYGRWQVMLTSSSFSACFPAPG